ncbi:MAG: lysophospholipid acyltransferase family protein [Kiritimatiellae bacterium]|nr:lysophospholipid acyltransferase family protein [Kiritimatiellia bacterium]
MNDRPYLITKFLGQPAFLLSRNPLVIGRENLPQKGACFLAANHSSYFDIPLLVVEYPRTIDYIAGAELFNHPFAAAFYRLFKPIPYRRDRRDPQAVRAVCERAKLGRTIGIFPEGGIRRGPQSILEGGPIRPGLGRLAILTQAPVIPVVLLGSELYYHPRAWLPLHRTSYCVGFGKPMLPPANPGNPRQLRILAGEFEADYSIRMRALHHELKQKKR